MTSIIFKKRVFYAPKVDKNKARIEQAKDIVESLELEWDSESDTIQCWIGSTIQIKESDSYIEIYFENGDLDMLISHVVEFKNEILLRNISRNFNIDLFKLRYKNPSL